MRLLTLSDGECMKSDAVLCKCTRIILNWCFAEFTVCVCVCVCVVAADHRWVYRRGVVVVSLVVSTKLLYAEPG